MKRRLLLKNATIYTGYTDKVLKDHDILIIDSKIAKVDKDIKDIDAKIIDCRNKFITPGLINIHAHLFGSGIPKKSLGKSKSQDFLVRFVKTPLGHLVIRKIAKENAKKQLMGGVTTLRTSGDFEYCDIYLRDKHLNNLPRLIVPGYAITSNTGHGNGTFAITSDNPEQLRKMVRHAKSLGVDYIKACTTGGVMDASKKGEPGEVKVSKEQLHAIVDEAHKCGLYVASHTESPEGVELDIKCGVDFIEHGSLFNDDLIKEIKNKNIKFTLTLTPSIPFSVLDNKITKCGSFTRYNSVIVTNNMISCAKKVLDNNIPLGLGTDAACPFSLQHLSYREMLYAQKTLGISALKAIELMTINNARLIGLSKLIGSIEENKYADLLVLPNDPIKDLDNFYNLDLIIHNGIIFKQKRYPKFYRYEKIIKSLEIKSEYPLID